MSMSKGNLILAPVLVIGGLIACPALLVFFGYAGAYRFRAGLPLSHSDLLTGGITMLLSAVVLVLAIADAVLLPRNDPYWREFGKAPRCSTAAAIIYSAACAGVSP
jgi:hypothetical protein